MTKIQVCLCTVISNKDLSMLDRVHGSRIDIDIRIKFLHGHLITSCLEKPSQGRCRDPFTQSGYNTACNKNIFN